MKQKENGAEHNPNSGFKALNIWLDEIGRSHCTGWRWRKLGWLKVTNINGRNYLSAEAISDFNKRATNGDFAKARITPKRNSPGL